MVVLWLELSASDFCISCGLWQYDFRSNLYAVTVLMHLSCMKYEALSDSTRLWLCDNVMVKNRMRNWEIWTGLACFMVSNCISDGIYLICLHDTTTATQSCNQAQLCSWTSPYHTTAAQRQRGNDMTRRVVSNHTRCHQLNARQD